MEYIGMDVHNRYLAAAILDHNSTDPEECRIKAERDELEEFAANPVTERFGRELVV